MCSSTCICHVNVIDITSQDFDRRVIPVGGLDEIIVDDKLMVQLKEIVQFEKAR